VTPEASERLGKFFGSFATRTGPILLLDYDGTLAGFRVNRFTARPWAGVPKLIDEIQREGSTRIAVITGRPATEIPAMLSLRAPLEVWGLHGAERLYPDGTRELEESPPMALRRLDEVRERLRRDALGGLFEDKPNAAVMHWRGHSVQQARQIERRTRALFEPLAEIDGLALLEFEAGIELRVGRDKGGAVKAILAEAGRGRPVSYLGDDLTDESAFRAVNSADAAHLSVLMRRERRMTDADVWLRPPDELRVFLKRWIAALEGQPRDRSETYREIVAAN
jgi:trehalose 6-phosphate phosphatase